VTEFGANVDFLKEKSTQEMDSVGAFCLPGCPDRDYRSSMHQSTLCTLVCWTTKVHLFSLLLFMVTLNIPKVRKFDVNLRN